MSSLDVSDDSNELPASSDSAVISSLQVISRPTSCLNVALLATASSEYYFPKRATITVIGDD